MSCFCMRKICHKKNWHQFFCECLISWGFESLMGRHFNYIAFVWSDRQAHRDRTGPGRRMYTALYLVGSNPADATISISTISHSSNQNRTCCETPRETSVPVPQKPEGRDCSFPSGEAGDR